MKLPDGLLALLRQPSTCYIATTMADGSPQMTQTWVDTDGENVLINSVQGYVKLRTSRVTRAWPLPSPLATTHHAMCRYAVG